MERLCVVFFNKKRSVDLMAWFLYARLAGLPGENVFMDD
jgi:hypothetical protein